jgi:hypothetical protein
VRNDGLSHGAAAYTLGAACPLKYDRRMVRICAWCHRYLGIKQSHQGGISHGICRPCTARQQWKQSPVLVVSAELKHVVPVLEELLRGEPAIRIVLERRNGDRRRSGERRAESRGSGGSRTDRRAGAGSRRALYLTRDDADS